MGVEVLIVDNDPIASGLTDELLRAAGFTTLVLYDSRKTLDAIRRERPRAALLDIMMPGVDGLTLCKQIKADPDLSGLKVIIVSGKVFKDEKDRARRYGAELFIEKPYDVDIFAGQVTEVIGPPAGPPAASAPADTLTVRAWGARSLARPERPDLPTPCVSVECQAGAFVFDAGSGAVACGRELAAGGRKELWLLLTHYHHGHVQSLGLFPCLRVPGFSIRLGGPADPDTPLSERLKSAIVSSYADDPSPVKAKIQIFEFQEGGYDLGPGVRLSTFYANHPSTTLAYRLEAGGRRVVYCPDSELYGDAAAAQQDYDEMLGNFCRGADLLIHDGRWRPEDAAGGRGKGHSCYLDAVNFAMKEEAARLWLFHADASYPETVLAELERRAAEEVKSRGSNLSVAVAREGLAVSI